ncbi:tyrosine-protein phosphatase 17 [Eurytemora carolleeae]|uniref:tyrosine-protein phosphatase 17 n=1 Tax=Eurytemora carolleeae TaxID=1294199 RepID=UPI000C777F1E|nr:tyrosine-protein phosphatase 17 [Eurytemora carolleeae]|eukprot:XP_023323716.1 tyrosine-protein phosphatase 17-like [Eurytemora affinis]
MIWQYDIRVVVMLTAVLESCGIKCNTYWPDILGDTRKYNDISIQLLDIAEAPTYVVRKFDLGNRNSSNTRPIVHIQYTQWPDR